MVGDSRVQFEVVTSTPPHPLSPYDESVFGYNTVKTSIRQVWAEKDIVVVPGELTKKKDLFYEEEHSQQILSHRSLFVPAG